MTLYTHWRDIPKSAWRWENFHPSEIACKGTGSLRLDVDAMDKLQTLRNAIGKPFIITSAYRSPIYNARVGGAPRSMHKTGKAFDVSLRGHDKDALFSAARAVGFGGVALARSFIHVDTGRKRTWKY